MTFDDGFANNFATAAILAEQEVKAVYFVVTDFVEADDPLAFYYSNISPGGPPRELRDNTPVDLAPLSQAQLREMSQMGHVIGSHGLTHHRLQSLSAKQSHYELHESSDKIQTWIGWRPDFFASPLDSRGMSKSLLNLVAQSYRLHFTTLDLPNGSRGPQLVFRTNLEFYWPESRRDFAWRFRRPEIARWSARNRDFAR